MDLLGPRHPMDALVSSICEFEQEPVLTGRIVFYGDSRFTRWKPKYGNVRMEDDLIGRDGNTTVINHGFGTSMMDELLFYYHRAVLPWKPRALVVAAGGNDFWRNYSVFEIVFLMERLMEHARLDMPGIRLFLCDAGVSLRHADDKETSYTYFRDRLNHMFREYCAEHSDTEILSAVHYPGFFEDPSDVGNYSKIRRDIFIEDRTHFNPEGYRIYRDFFRETLKEIL